MSFTCEVLPFRMKGNFVMQHKLNFVWFDFILKYMASTACTCSTNEYHFHSLCKYFYDADERQMATIMILNFVHF